MQSPIAPDIYHAFLFAGGNDVLAPEKDTDLTKEKLKRGGVLAGETFFPDYSHVSKGVLCNKKRWIVIHSCNVSPYGST